MYEIKHLPFVLIVYLLLMQKALMLSRTAIWVEKLFQVLSSDMLLFFQDWK